MNEAKSSASPRRKLSESGSLKIDIPKSQFNFAKRPKKHERYWRSIRIEGPLELYKCLDTFNNNFVLIKTVTVLNTDAIDRKISILQELDHENVARLLDVVKDVEFNLTTYTMILDNLDTTSLSDVIQRHTLNSVLMKKYLYQILHGLSYLHSLGIILRDLQPDYLLINSMRQIVKIANLVLVKKYDVSACDNFDKFRYTKYSAPELILQLKNYSNAVDMWSVGCIFARMVLNKPLFSGEIDVVIDIFRSFGGPNEDNWPGLTSSSVDTCFWGMPKDIDWLLAVKVSGLEEDGLDLLSKILCLNPAARITAQEAIAHPCFGDIRDS